jgi:NADH:ubiquinone oxidoreductase subunit 3 (subunit A)
MNIEWGIVFLWIIICLLFAILLFIIGYLLVVRPVDIEKISSYECGFNPFEDVYGRFDIRFYLVAILFIIFDLEVTFLFPWALTLHSIDMVGLFSMTLFVLILTLGFFYEWNRGALEW